MRLFMLSIDYTPLCAISVCESPQETTFSWFLFLPLGSLPRRDKAGLGRPEAAPVRHERSDPPASGRPEDGPGRPEAAALAARLAEGSSQTLTRENPFRDAILGLGRSLQQIIK
jgi:hypothetical protein